MLPEETCQQTLIQYVEPAKQVRLEAVSEGDDDTVPHADCALTESYKMHDCARKRRRTSSTCSSVSRTHPQKRAKPTSHHDRSSIWTVLPVVYLCAVSLPAFDRRVPPYRPLRSSRKPTTSLLETDISRLKVLARTASLDFSHIRGVCCIRSTELRRGDADAAAVRSSARAYRYVKRKCHVQHQLPLAHRGAVRHCSYQRLPTMTT